MPRTLFPAALPETRARLEQSETRKLINDFDWSATVLGPIPEWTASLRGAVRMMVAAETPMVMLTGRQGILIYNDAYAEFAGQRHPAIFGQPVLEAWPEIADFNRHKLELGFAGETLILRDQELVLNRHGAMESGWMDLHYSPVLGEDGLPEGVLCIVHETTDRVLTEQALARSEERLTMALSGSGLIGTWDWDTLADRLTADNKFAILHQVDPLRAGLGEPIANFLAAIHPDDRARVEAEIQAAMADGTPYRSEYRLLDAAGGIHWVVASGRVRFDGAGKPARFPGVVVDITEQKTASAALAESELRFRTLADAMPQMVWSTLPDGFHDYYNARWYEFTGVPEGSTDGEGWNGMFHPNDQQRAWETWRHSLETGEDYEIEYRLRHHSGAYRWTLGRALPLRDDGGRIIRWIGTCTDIDDSKLAAEERALVAQELAHRIKNIFAVLTGIIGLSVRNRPELRPFANQLRERIFALSEAHDFFRIRDQSSSSGRDWSLQTLMRRLVRPYQDEAETRIAFAGDDTDIDDGAATPLALVVHELATNSAKYGALSAPEGRVGVLGRIDGDRYHLTWSETGGPALSEGDRAEGFGSRLVALSIQGQMRGELTRRWERDGLVIEIELPIDALNRSARLKAEMPA